MNAYQAARNFADRVNATFGAEVLKPQHVWTAEKCKALQYPAKAAVNMEESGLEAFSFTAVLAESGYGRAIELKGQAPKINFLVEPYASWLLCFYEEVS